MAETSEQTGGGEGETPRSTGEIVRETAGVFGAVFAVVLAATLLAQVSSLVASALYLIVAVAFVFPVWWLIDVRGCAPESFGLRGERIWRDVGFGGLLVAVTLIPFAGGFYLWQTQVVGETFAFEWSNFEKWSPQHRGQPAQWGEKPGVWTWADEREIRVGMRAGAEGEVRAELRLDRPAVPSTVGPVELQPAGGGGGDEPARHWRARLERPHKRAEIALRPDAPGTGAYPRRVEISVGGSEAADRLFVGPSAERVDRGGFAFERGVGWILSWVLTQLVFIALPEEVFYRGYLQTRIGQAVAAYRLDPSSDREAAEPRSWLGVTEQNVVTSVIFGLAHLLVPVGGRLVANRASVAFPSLVFGWLRDRTDSIGAAVVYHAGCNMMVLLAAPHFF